MFRVTGWLPNFALLPWFSISFAKLYNKAIISTGY